MVFPTTVMLYTSSLEGVLVMRKLVHELKFPTFLLASGLLATAADRSLATWSEYLGGADSSQYSSLKQINKSNVKQLEVAWTYPTGAGAYTFDPLNVDGIMYVLAQNNSVVALEAATGKEMWVHPNMGAVGQRGMNYWESNDRSDRRLLYINGGFLTAINARTGQTVNSFGDNGRTDLRAGLDRDPGRALQTSNPGRIFEDIIITPLPAGSAGYDSTPADIHAYSTITGKLLWTFHVVPQPGEFGYDTWPPDAWKTSGGVHNWNEMTSMKSEASLIFRSEPPGTISTAEIAKAIIYSEIHFSRWTPVPESGCGIFRSCITISGITISPALRSCSLLNTMVRMWTSSRSRPSSASCTCLIA